MRIRKNYSKISALLCQNSSENLASKSLLQEVHCELNQSPWDIITFPPADSSSPSLDELGGYEVRYVVNPARNGDSIDPTGAAESGGTADASVGGEATNGGGDDGGSRGGAMDEVKEVKEEEEEEVLLCSTIDSKGWQCGRVVRKGNTMCDDHVAQYENKAGWTAKRKQSSLDGDAAGPSKPRRAKRAATAASNPSEYYYYSGFGPSWAKRRGAAEAADVAAGGSKGTTLEAYGTRANGGSFDHLSVVCDDNADGQCEEEAKRVKVDATEASPSMMPFKQEEVVELDNAADDAAEEVVEKKVVGRKRGRKPIKARSLKSLM